MLFASLAGAASAQAPLSKIQDVLFKADGARFTGTLVIHWSTFDANNLGTVIQQSKTVSVLNGNLQLQLVANATAQPPANLYTVSYQSDGREQFTETWSVPASSLPLTVAQIRVGTTTASGGGGSGGSGGLPSSGNSTPVPESTVVGLVGDLAQRPSKGPGYGTGAVAVINSSGQIETAVGTLGDCVFVDGTTGPCGGPAPTFVDAEVPVGAIDGTNTVFTLQNPPSGSTLVLSRNGVILTPGGDFTLFGNTLTFINNAQPRAQDSLVATYRIDPAGNIGQLRHQVGQNVTLAQVVCSSSGRATSSTLWMSLAGCDIPAAAIRSGDRFEIRFTFTKSGTSTAYDVLLNWGSFSMLTRHAGPQDAVFIGKSEAAVTQLGAHISVESWGSVLPFLPGIVSVGPQNGLRIDFRAKMAAATADSVTLSNFTVLRYPGN